MRKTTPAPQVVHQRRDKHLSEPKLRNNRPNRIGLTLLTIPSNTDSSSRSTTHRNSSLNAGGNLTINTDKTKIAGANVEAEAIDLTTKELQDSKPSKHERITKQVQQTQQNASAGTGGSISGGASKRTTPTAKQSLHRRANDSSTQEHKSP